ncbi:MAG TPA: hypothetical protein VGC13_11240 [Longimicrobium sp.]|jgi:hypothetical protein|uniref:hypothetical protein n=1 Tax=Longimicrobium sp. TaxID=2029185 RepID=UPI002EDBA364
MIPARAELSLMLGTVLAVPAPAAVTQCLQAVEVTVSDDAMTGFQLTFNTEPGASTAMEAVRALLLKPFSRVVVTAVVNGFPHVLVDGLITKLDNQPAQGGRGASLIASGLDVSVAMTLHESSSEYPVESAAMIVERLILGYAVYGMVPAVIPAPLLVPPIPVDRTPIEDGTDLGAIQELARQVGYVFYVTAGPVPLANVAYWGPPVRIGIPQSALSVDLGPATNVESLTFEYDAMKPMMVYGDVLDLTTNLKVPVEAGISLRLPPLASIPALIANLPYTRRTLLSHPGLNVAQAEVLAQAMVDRSTDEVVTAQGELDTFRYGGVLRARGLVGVRGAGTLYDGMYYVKSLRHSIARGSWKQGFTLVREGLGPTVPLVLP